MKGIGLDGGMVLESELVLFCHVRTRVFSWLAAWMASSLISLYLASNSICFFLL